VGKPVTGAVDVTFSLYNTEAGGEPLWFETQTVQADDLGRYTALLGAMHTDGLPLDLFTSGEVRWLGIQVGTEAEQQPRVLLVSVPYALKAGDAETLGGKPASAYMLNESQNDSTATTTLAASPSTTTPAGGNAKSAAKGRSTKTTPLTSCSVTSDTTATANSVALFTTNCNIQSSAITQSGGNIGIGTSSPTFRLHLVDDTDLVQFELQSASPSTGPNLYLNNTGVTKGGKFLRSFSGNFQVVNNDYTAALLTVTEAGTVSATMFSGSGAGLTSLPASGLTGGITVAGSGTGGLSVALNATSPDIVNGFSGNNVSGGVLGGTISGGGESGNVNSVTLNFGTVGGGIANTAGSLATVGGGQGNTASGSWAVIGGGATNTASGSFATIVGGGTGNTAFANNSSIDGGTSNFTGDTLLSDHTIGLNSTVGGGKSNSASGSYSTIPGGDSNTTGSSADHSFAAGFGAVANHTGTFVWADNVGAGTKTTFTSTAANQFLIRASGGVGIGTASPQATLDTAGQDRRKPVTFSTLTACSSTIEGETAAVTDSNTATWGATITAGGSTNHVLAYCDGTNWTVAAK
jgi:hypothetical protein